MKKFLLFLCAIGLAFGLVSPAAADSLVVDTNTSDSNINPQELGSSGLATERTWLEALLGFDVYDYGKEEDGDGNDGTWDNPVWAEGPYSTDWTYAVLKFGVGSLPDQENHWAILDDGDQIVDLSISGLPSSGSLKPYHLFLDCLLSTRTGYHAAAWLWSDRLGCFWKEEVF